MLVYGDAVRLESAADQLDRIGEMLGEWEALPAGLPRHAALVAALIDAGELAQGIADGEFRARGERDGASPAAAAAMALTTAIAELAARSWSSGFAAYGALPRHDIERCAAVLPVAPIEIRQPEGYAFYALYPEIYFEAARLCAQRDWQVIGIRSIGTSLAAMVAAAIGAGAPVTLRPVGHPFDRQIAGGELRPDRDAAGYAVVDEGPGLSGSSMAAVANWLRSAGVPAGRVHFFPSHGNGPGAQASPATRTAWSEAQVHVASFEQVVLDAAEPAHRLDSWVAALVGALREPLRDVGGGAWRRHAANAAANTPPVHPWQERRKYLAETRDGGRWLVKFAGLGRYGAHKFARARTLAAAGFTPEPAGLCHGFLVERWCDDLSAMTEPPVGALRERVLRRIGEYLAFRARWFPATNERGATLAQLHAMGRHNTCEALGSELGARWDDWLPGLGAMESQVQRVETDNRMHVWEWLTDGHSILKTDAVDHHAGHDLVGCQDIAWDIAGAAVEFDLSAVEHDRLAACVAQSGASPVGGDLLRFLRWCYLAFQLGYYREAAGASSDPAETDLLEGAARRYTRGLQRVLASGLAT